MEITVKLTNLGKSVAELEAYRGDLDRNINTIVKRTVESCEKKADTNFRNAQYDGTNDVKVTSLAVGKGGEVEAFGRATLFIEFGTGVYHNRGENYGRDLGYGYGTYGPKGLQLGWGYFGEPGTNGIQRKSGVVLTRGNPANRCMYNAIRDVKKEVPKIAREVFK